MPSHQLQSIQKDPCCTHISIHQSHIHFLKENLEDTSPFCGVTDTPVLDFWLCLLWVSKLEWAALFTHDRGTCVTSSLRFTSGVTPADLLEASMAAEPISFTYLWASIGGAQNWDLLFRRWTLFRLSYAGSAQLHSLVSLCKLQGPKLKR